MRIVGIGREFSINPNKKTPVPSFDDIEGTRVKRIVYSALHTRGATLIAFHSHLEMPYSGYTLTTTLF
jgi:hypothetical protein